MHKWRICPIFQLKAISYYDIHLSNSPALCIMLVYSPRENGTSTPELPLTELQFKNCSKLKLGVLTINIEFIPVIFWYAQIHAVMGDHNRIFYLIMVWFLLRYCKKWHKWDIHRLSVRESASKTLFSGCATF